MRFNPEALAGKSTEASPLRVAVVVATIRRSEEVGQLLTHLAMQSQLPSAVILSVETLSDLPAHVPPGIEVIMGSKGLTRQRNRGLARALSDSDVVVFYDDDFVPASGAIAGISGFFLDHPNVVGATGLVLRDGVKDGGVAYEDAVALVSEHERVTPTTRDLAPTVALYGCNMAFRTAAIGNFRFDESLPLYGWQEDVDFTGQMMKRGATVRTNAFAGVHRGVSKGRSSGVALGYSQMVNPIYLVRKGTMPVPKAMLLMLKNMLANHAKLLRPEPFIDRAGRCKGNWLGLLDMLRLRCNPQRMLAL